MVFGYEDAVTLAKAITDFAKDHDKKPVFKLGIMDNKILQAEQLNAIAQLPSRDVLYSMLAGVLEAPMAALASALEAKIQETAGLIDALREEREKAG
jgi:large subunit ribosomal protein L10